MKPTLPEPFASDPKLTERVLGEPLMSNAYSGDDSAEWYERDSIAWSSVTNQRTYQDWSVFYAPPFLQSGDYSGNGTVGESNYLVFLEEYGDYRGVWELYGSHGIYVPKIFTSRFDPDAWGVSKEDADILRAGPDHDLYWETWEGIEGRAEHTNKEGVSWVLYQDGDLWAHAVSVRM